MGEVERRPWNDVVYGDPIVCSYGSRIIVSQSSAAERPYCWLRVTGFNAPPQGSRLADGRPRPVGFDPDKPYQAAAHLTRDMAQGLIDRLQAWLDDTADERDNEEG